MTTNRILLYNFIDFVYENVHILTHLYNHFIVNFNDKITFEQFCQFAYEQSRF